MIVYGELPLRFARHYFKMPFIGATAIGFVENFEFHGAVVFDHYTTMADGSPCSMEASVIVLDKKWITRYNLRQLFDYCFIQVNLKSLVLRCGRSEKIKRRLIERLGFHYEGISRNTWPYGGDAVRYSMLPPECKWL